MFLRFGYYEQYCYEYLCTNSSVDIYFSFPSGIYVGIEFRGHMVTIFFLTNCQTGSFKVAAFLSTQKKGSDSSESNANVPKYFQSNYWSIYWLKTLERFRLLESIPWNYVAQHLDNYLSFNNNNCFHFFQNTSVKQVCKTHSWMTKAKT